MKSGEKAGRGCGVLGVGGGFVVGRRTEGRDENTAGKRCTRCINIYTNDKKSNADAKCYLTTAANFVHCDVFNRYKMYRQISHFIFRILNFCMQFLFLDLEN